MCKSHYLSPIYHKLLDLLSSWKINAPTEIVSYIDDYYSRLLAYSNQLNQSHFANYNHLANPSQIDHIPTFLNAVIPKNTLPISITDEKCDLKCAHCNAHFLKFMFPLSNFYKKNKAGNNPKSLNSSNISSLLISGGCNKTGEVPILQHIENVIGLVKNFKSNMHVGLIQNFDYFYENFKFYKDSLIISYDLIGSDLIAKEVYNLPYPSSMWLETYKQVYNHFNVIPHLTLGLHAGKIDSEINVIDFLVEYKPKSLTFLVLKPTANTSYQDIIPPNPVDVANVITYAKNKLNITLALGCMRPSKDNWRYWGDRLAWLAGANTIVMPNTSFLQDLMTYNIKVNYFYECCAFINHNSA